ncbi:hypothetical protein BKK81_00015 [Cupriavidus sp. USMAHM13]|uniref:hypothetical protein n=1 Tax=Cupriavidus sp. USMAHM13 TaxID=1389192 RepID=UPI0008A68046|nr:hypothetical protein [Cupriavidus sp. USMAHM13]AOY97854.1 hypothetical protein BKK81_00015 [Cupriavidus sp. USMAHM13]
MKSFLLIGAALAAASVSFSAVAGPDFYIIEKGRDAKRAVQRAEAAQAAQASRPCRLRKPRRQRSRP